MLLPEKIIFLICSVFQKAMSLFSDFDAQLNPMLNQNLYLTDGIKSNNIYIF